MANLPQIQKYLELKQLGFNLIDLNKEAFTVADVIDAGIKIDEVVKTLIVRTNDCFIALALCGENRVDFKKIRTKFGGHSELAKPEEVLKIVGVPVGAVCPIMVGVPLYIEEKVMDLENVHMGSGDLMYGLEMKLEDLIKAVGDYEQMDFGLNTA